MNIFKKIKKRISNMRKEFIVSFVLIGVNAVFAVVSILVGRYDMAGVNIGAMLLIMLIRLADLMGDMITMLQFLIEERMINIKVMERINEELEAHREELKEQVLEKTKGGIN